MLFTFPSLWPITMIFLHHAQTSPQHLFMCCLSTYTFLLSLVTFLIIVCLHFLFISNWITSIIFVIFYIMGLYITLANMHFLHSVLLVTLQVVVYTCVNVQYLQLHGSRALSRALQAKSCNQIPRGGSAQTRSDQGWVNLTSVVWK